MADPTSPETLRALVAGLQTPATQAVIDALLAHAEAWAGERVERAGLEEQLAVAQKRVEVLEQDRKWWQDNAIKRRKRAEARRSGR